MRGVFILQLVKQPLFFYDSINAHRSTRTFIAEGWLLRYQQAVEGILGVPLLPHPGYDVREKDSRLDIRLRMHDAVMGIAHQALGQSVEFEAMDGPPSSSARAAIWQHGKEPLTQIRRQVVVANNVVQYARTAEESDRIDRQLYDFIQYPAPVTAAPTTPGPLDALRNGMVVSMIGPERRSEIARLLRHVGVGRPCCAEDPTPIRALLAVAPAWLKDYLNSSFQRELGESVKIEPIKLGKANQGDVALTSYGALAARYKAGAAPVMSAFPVRILEEVGMLFPSQYLDRLGALGARALLFTFKTNPHVRPALAAHFPDFAIVRDRQPPAVQMPASPEVPPTVTPPDSPSLPPTVPPAPDATPPAAVVLPATQPPISIRKVRKAASKAAPSARNAAAPTAATKQTTRVTPPPPKAAAPPPAQERRKRLPTFMPEETGSWRSTDILRRRMGCDEFTLQVLLGHLGVTEERLKRNERGIVVAVDAKAEQAARRYPINPAPPLRMPTVAAIASIASERVKGNVTVEDVQEVIMRIEEARDSALTPGECTIGRNEDYVVEVYLQPRIASQIISRIQAIYNLARQSRPKKP